MKFVLLYSHRDEPITQVLLSSELDQKFTMIKLSLETLLQDVTIIDELNGINTKVEWMLPSGIQISNSSDFYLINRVLSVPETLVQDFAEEDRDYSLSELRAYLAFAIEAFPYCFSKPRAFGLSGNRFSLPRQWEMIKQTGLPLKVPHYYLGNMYFCQLEGEIVYSKPSNFYYWKPNPNIKDQTAFAFEKPKGIPIVACIVGDHTEVFSYYSHHPVSLKDYSLIKEQVLNLSRLFDYSIAEALFFLDNQEVSFGMISNIPYASRNKPWFSNMICSFFVHAILEKNGKN